MRDHAGKPATVSDRRAARSAASSLAHPPRWKRRPLGRTSACSRVGSHPWSVNSYTQDARHWMRHRTERRTARPVHPRLRIGSKRCHQWAADAQASFQTHRATGETSWTPHTPHHLAKARAAGAHSRPGLRRAGLQPPRSTVHYHRTLLSTAPISTCSAAMSPAAAIS